MQGRKMTTEMSYLFCLLFARSCISQCLKFQTAQVRHFQLRHFFTPVVWSVIFRFCLFSVPQSSRQCSLLCSAEQKSVISLPSAQPHAFSDTMLFYKSYYYLVNTQTRRFRHKWHVSNFPSYCCFACQISASACRPFVRIRHWSSQRNLSQCTQLATYRL